MTELDYKSIYDRLPDAIFISDQRTGRILDCNYAAEKLTGRSRAEILGMRQSDLYPGGEGSNGFSKFSSFVSGDGVADYEAEVLTNDGENVRVMITASSVRVKDTNAVMQVVRRVAAGKQADTALQRSEERFQALIENAFDILAVLNENGSVRYISPSVRILGYEVEGVAGKATFDFVHPDDLPGLMKAFAEIIIRPGATVSTEVRMRHKDGSWHVFEAVARNLLDNPHIAGVVINAHDITERKRVEEELRQYRQHLEELVDERSEQLRKSEQNLHLMFESVRDAIFVTDLEARITDVNEEAVRLCGCSHKEELIGMSGMELLVEQEHAKAVDSMRQVAEEELRGTREYVVRSKDGRETDCDIGASVVRDESGTPVGFVAIARDITERKKAEEALWESENRYRSFVQNFRGIAFRTKGDFTPDFFHGAVEEITGYTEAEFTAGRPRWDQILHPDDLPKMGEAAERLMSTPGASAKLEHRILRKDGEVRWVLEAVQSVPDESGKLAYIQGVIIDITERKEMEKAVWGSEAKLKQIYHNIRDSVTLFDVNGNIIDVNPQVADLSGYSPDEIVNRNFADLGVLDPEQSAQWAEHLKAIVAGAECILPFVEMQIRHKNGHLVAVEVATSPVTGEDGRLEGLLAVLRDVRERKQVEEHLAKLKNERDAQIIHTAKLASLGEMAAGIAHEINQPLNIIKLACSGLNRSMKRGKTITPEMVSEELRSIDDQVERMRVIIDHMRTFARRSTDMKSEYVDMNVPLKDCFNFVGEQLRLREIDVELDLRELPQVKADSNKLEQVFLNIIGNARDAMDEFAERAGSDYKKEIKVRSFVENDKAVVTFTDTGGGIPENIQDRVCEPFFTTKEVGKGTGLGLSISYNIVKGFGGDLEFSVEDGVGTTFRVAVPTVNREPNTAKDPSSSPP